jgi:PelA/Pel-15E family pectate lyase
MIVSRDDRPGFRSRLTYEPLPRGSARQSSRVLALLLLLGCTAADADNEELRARAADTLHRATAYFRDQVAVEGSYLWRYSADLREREGEHVATATQGWVQPPGTPAIGMAYLQAYAATGDRSHLDGAIEVAHGLADTQMQSGGWYYSMEFDRQEQRRWCYRVDPADCPDSGDRHRNSSTIDDNTSQSALRLLMLVDRILDGSDPAIHEAVTYGLDQFMLAQYPNGAWPVDSARRVPREAAPAIGRAQYPVSWQRTFVVPGYLFYVTNDDAMRDMIRTFLLAHRLYGREDYQATALRAGQFLLDAQMPAPQSGWAQTYNGAMEPIWGRKFEPPAIVSLESVGVIEALLDLYLYTGDRRYLDSAGVGLEWLEASRLPEGDWARFYELGSNRPLYMTSDYRLTYEDDDLPTHYRFRVTPPFAQVQDIYHQIVDQGREAYLAALAGEAPAGTAAGIGQVRPAMAPDQARTLEVIIEQLDDQGRWLDDDGIEASTLIRNYGELTRFLLATQPPARSSARAIGAIADPMGNGLHAEVFGLVEPRPSAATGLAAEAGES